MYESIFLEKENESIIISDYIGRKLYTDLSLETNLVISKTFDESKRIVITFYHTVRSVEDIFNEYKIKGFQEVSRYKIFHDINNLINKRIDEGDKNIIIKKECAKDEPVEKIVSEKQIMDIIKRNN